MKKYMAKFLTVNNVIDNSHYGGRNDHSTIVCYVKNKKTKFLLFLPWMGHEHTLC